MNILIETLPDAVTVDGREYLVYTDYRDWITFTLMFMDNELSEKEKVISAFQWFYEMPPYSAESIKTLSWFLFCGKTEKQTDKKTAEKEKPIFSYECDAHLLIAAFIEQYGIDLTNIDYLHWWKFKALFDGLNDHTTLKQYMQYRSIDTSKIKDKEERRRIRRIQAQIKLPEQTINDADIAEVLGAFF